MTEIKFSRDLNKFAGETHDLIIVGGGIYGIMLAYEAVRQNLRPLLLEKNDYSHATSLNHLRTVHGGLRYLQSVDLSRFKESVGERKWFLQYFPQYVNLMPCLLPLYGAGLQRNTILRAALIMNDLLSFKRNRAVPENRHLPNGQVISSQKTKEIFPLVDTDGLTGSALWYDASVQEYQRMVMKILKSAVAGGASAANYMDVQKLLKNNDNVTGVEAIDQETGKTYTFNAPVIINAAGPGSRDMAASFDRDHFPLFKKRLLLWNVLFDKEALSSHALGLSPGKGKGHTYFFHPWKDRLLVGTGELVVEKSDTETKVPPDQMEKFIADINRMAPGLNLSKNNVLRVYPGILPATEKGKLAGHEVIFQHEAKGGPKGLYSISGVKFTTSRLVAEKPLTASFPIIPINPSPMASSWPASMKRLSLSITTGNRKNKMIWLY